MNKKQFTAAFGITTAMAMGYVGFNSIVFAEEAEEPVVVETQDTSVEAPVVQETATTEPATATVYVQNNESTVPAEPVLKVAEETDAEPKPSTLVKFVTKADDTKTYQVDAEMALEDAAGNTVATWTSKTTPQELILEYGDYTLKVVNAPEGYIPGKDVQFTVGQSDLLTEDGKYSVVSNSGGAWRVQNSAGSSVIGYCLNSNKSSGTGAGEIYTQHALTAEELNAYLTNNSNSTITSADQLKKEILKVVYNGGENDRLGLKEKYGLSDYNMVSYTQTAIWRLTNGDGTADANSTNVSEKAIYELLNTDQYAPDNLDFHVFTNTANRQQYASAVTMEVKLLEVFNLKALEAFVSKVTPENIGLAGAVIEIVDADGEVVYSYTSTDQNEALTLGAGTYTMREVSAPEGYELAEDITFRILEDGSVEVLENGEWVAATDNIVVMIDLAVVELPFEPEEPGQVMGAYEEPTPEEEVVAVKEEVACKEEPKEIAKAAGIQTGAATGTMAIVSMMAMAMAGAIKSRKEM